MEYNTDGMAPLQPNIFKRAWQSITLPHYGRTIGFLALLVITLAVPATISFLGNRTTTKNQAAGGVNGEVKFSSDPQGNTVINTTANPELYLKISLPDTWHLPGQGAVQKSSPIAYSPIKNIIQKTYAATFCTSPAVCSNPTGVGSPWVKTGQTCTLFGSEGDESEGACYINSSTGGSNPTATPNPGSGGGSTGSCSTYNNNCGGCLNQSACAYTDGGQCVSVADPNHGNICPAGKTTWYWANCSTNECSGGGGSQTGRCGLVQVQNHSVALNGNIPVRIVYGGNPTKVKFWVSSDSEIGKNSTEVSSWSPIGEQSLTSSDAVYQVSSSGFSAGQHAVLAQLLSSNGTILDENTSTCTDSFNLGSGGSNPTTTPTPAAGGGIIPTLTAPTNDSTINTSGTTLWWDRITGDNNTNTMYHIRVIDNADSLAKHADFPASVTRECNDYFICHATRNNWLQINLPNNGQYSWYVDAEQDTSRGIHTGTFTFTVSGSSGGTPPGQGVTLTQIHIQNTDEGSGGLPATRITGATDLARFFANPYWKLNPTGNGTTRKVQVVFYGTDAQGNPMQKQTEEATITYTGTTPPTPIPTRTPSACERKPSIMGPLGDVVSDDLYVWVQVDKGGQPLSSCSDAHDDNVCTVRPGPSDTPAEKAAKNADCPPNTSQGTFVNSQTSNWCRMLPDGNDQVAHCWQLRYIPPAPTAQPTQTTQPGAPTATIRPGAPAPTATITPSGTDNCSSATTCAQCVTLAECGWNGTLTGTGTCQKGSTSCPTGTTNWYPASCTPSGNTCSRTPSPTPTGTITPTATPIPTPTSTVTPPPPGPASVTFKVILAGIGVKATKGTESIVNDNPNQRKRDATLYLYEPGVDATGDFTGAKTINNGKGIIPQPKAIEYDDKGKFVAANFNLSTAFTAGQYQVFIWTPGYLRKRIPNIQTLNIGANTINQVVALTLGDANNDNLLNLLDYREYLSCLNKQTTACLKADFNDDGYIDNDDKHNGKEGNNKPSFLDHNLFTDQFALINGD